MENRSTLEKNRCYSREEGVDEDRMNIDGVHEDASTNMTLVSKATTLIQKIGFRKRLLLVSISSLVIASMLSISRSFQMLKRRHFDRQAYPLDRESWERYGCDGSERRTGQSCVRRNETFSKWLSRQMKNQSYERLACYVDKSAAKYYAKSKIPEIHVPSTLALFTEEDLASVEDFSFPSSFALKGTHGSGMAVLVTNNTVYCDNSGTMTGKPNMTNYDVKRHIQAWLNQTYNPEKEFQYRRIRKAAILEEFLGTGLPVDYKLFVFGGNVVAMDTYRFLPPPSGSLRSVRVIRRFMRPNATVLNATWLTENVPHIGSWPNAEGLFRTLLLYSSLLADGFRFARVDFYIHRAKIYFSEITLSPQRASTDLDRYFVEPHVEMLGRC